MPLSLAYSLSEDMERVKKGLTRIAQELGEDPSVGYTRKVVIRYLEEYGEVLGKTVGYKVFAGSALVSAQQPEHNASFVMFAQKSNHLYLYENFAATTTSAGWPSKPTR